MASADLLRNADESELAYIYRLGKLRDNGIIDMTWTELAEVLNRNLREPDEYLSESAYRKKYNVLRQGYEEIFSKNDNVDLCEEIVMLRRELEKEKIKLRDEKNDYRRIIREQARKESLEDFLGDAAKNLNEKLPLISITHNVGTSICKEKPIRREALLCLSDFHYGMETNNIWNKYNTTICVDRVRKCVNYAKRYIKLNGIQVLKISLLGDFAHGAIHSCPIYSRIDVCDQLMQVSEILAQAINELSDVVETVDIYSCYGNHMRTVQKKEYSKESDNMEKIIPWWLEQRLKDNLKVTIHYSEFKEFTLINMAGYNVVCVHGSGLNFKDIGVTTSLLFNKLFDVDVDYTVSGDKHHLEEVERFGIESILIRSLCGTDDYANNNRLYGKAGQTLMIFNEDYGRECTYHIPLD